ncbi:hypothetical protein [uncultured Succiniclasticum sp.]|uniref:hypothetical protein n=1 Tax=uncultured Succiniclasticum sp. TaxID=1500547 RepID=UPI0025E12310|nr:hypothetical protein [uncultured Succiniclasticum sp.]
MEFMVGICSVAFVFGAVIGVLYACIFYGIPLLFEILKTIIELIMEIPELYKAGVAGFKRGWNRHSSEQQN